MDPDGLRAFLAVVDTGSFVAAATFLRWSRGMLRRRVDELEAVVGVPLLVRSEQGAVPTPAGAELAARGRDVLHQSSALLASVREVAASATGTLRIAVPVGMPPQAMGLAYAAVRAHQPGLRIELRFAEHPLSLLVSDVDLAFYFGAEPSEGPWVSEEILRMPERLLASEAYLRARGTPHGLPDLAAHDLLLGREPGEPSALPLRAGGRFPVVAALTSADVHLLRSCASLGQGMAFCLDGGLLPSVGAGPELVPVLDDVVGVDRVLRLAMPAGFSEIPRLRAALDLIRSVARPLKPRG
jgi:DNA-binding transcriptional LysR family regulator